MPGEDVEQEFEAMRPQQDSERLCAQYLNTAWRPRPTAL